MRNLRVLDLDGSLTAQSSLFHRKRPPWVPARLWGPQIRLACTFGTFERFRRWLDGALETADPGITLYGSGDFHHVSLALLKRLPGPFNLLVLDKHPDWMRGIPFLHCGTWLRHALRLPNLKCVFHCGGELDFDNAYRWLAPWHEIKAGRVVVFPAQRQFVRGRWAGITVHPLLREGVTLATALNDALRPFRDELGRLPLYISIDKDVLSAEDAAVNWDSGLLRSTGGRDDPGDVPVRGRGPARRGGRARRLVADRARPLAEPALRSARPSQPRPRSRRGRRSERESKHFDPPGSPERIF